MISDALYLELNNFFISKISETDLTYKRYLYNRINWQARMICIRGPRGTGKTTMLLQYIKEHYSNLGDVLYVTLDDIRLQNLTIVDIAEYAHLHGIKALFLDEVHYIPHWEQMLKNVYDRFSTLKVVYTGSSILQLAKSEADMSRRQTVYDMTGFSFREYLLFKGIYAAEPMRLEDILSNVTHLTTNVFKLFRPIAYFDEYLKNGYYPFILEGGQDYYEHLQSIVNVVIFQDIPLIEKDISFATLQKARKLLSLLSNIVPLEPNISTLCREVGAAREVIIKLLSLLEKAGLLRLLKKDINSYKQLSRPDKIYLDNTNLMYALQPTVNKGSLRETFFMNQLSHIADVTMPEKGDFLVNEHYTFEIGGKDKTFKQIKDIPDSYLAVDDTEIGFGNRIPLWLFGFLY